MLLAIGIILLVLGAAILLAMVIDDVDVELLSLPALLLIAGGFGIYLGNIEENRKTEIQEQLVREVTIMVNNEVLYTGLFKGESSLPESYVRYMENGDKLNVLYNDVKVKEDHEK